MDKIRPASGGASQPDPKIWDQEKIDMRAEIDRLRAENTELERKLFVDRLSDAERIRIELCASMEAEDQRNRDEIDRLRAALERHGAHECAKYAQQLQNEIDRLRTRNAKLEDALRMIVSNGYDEASRVFAAEVATSAILQENQQ